MKKITLLLILFATATAGAQPADSTMRVHFIDVGQGHATLVEFPCGAMLVDTGAEQNELFDGVANLEAYLEAFFERRSDLDDKLGLLLLTHPHVDHLRGIETVLENFEVESIVDNGQRPDSTLVSSHLQALDKYVDDHDQDSSVGRYREVNLDNFHGRKPAVTSTIIDPFRMCQGTNPSVRVLWGRVPGDPGWGTDPYGRPNFGDSNNHSVVTRVIFGKTEVLLMGDLESVAIADLLEARRPQDLDADILQVGHHGSYNGTTLALLEAVTPEYAVIPMGPADRELEHTAWAYGHPREQVVTLLQQQVSGHRDATDVEVALGVKDFEDRQLLEAVYGTGWDGSVVLEADKTGNISRVDPDWSPEPSPAVHGGVAWETLPWGDDPDGILQVTFVDVEEGDAILIQLGETDVLVDTGAKATPDVPLADALATVSGPLEHLFITHAHNDHHGGGVGVLDALDVDQITSNGEGRPALTGWRDFEDAVTAEGLSIDAAAVDHVYDLGNGLTLTVLATGGKHDSLTSGKAINNDSLVMMLEYAGRKVLLTGDIQEETGEHLVDTYCDDFVSNCDTLQADVLKVPHHGSKHFDEDFLDATQATWAVVSAAYDKDMGGHYLPRIDVYQALTGLGVEVLSTSVEGLESVVLAIGPDGSMAWQAPDGPAFYWAYQHGQWEGLEMD